jgi:uncharacterized protein (DUF433 family)
LTLPVVLVPHPHVRVDKNVLGGSPHVAGSRVVVRRLWAFFKSGATVERILRRYPQLGPAKVFDALAFALDNPEVMEADLRREEEILRKSGEQPRRPAGAPEQIELPFASPRPGEPVR